MRNLSWCYFTNGGPRVHQIDGSRCKTVLHNRKRPFCVKLTNSTSIETDAAV